MATKKRGMGYETSVLYLPYSSATGLFVMSRSLYRTVYGERLRAQGRRQIVLVQMEIATGMLSGQ